jgi:hypothetical protein
MVSPSPARQHAPRTNVPAAQDLRPGGAGRTAGPSPSTSRHAWRPSDTHHPTRTGLNRKSGAYLGVGTDRAEANRAGFRWRDKSGGVHLEGAFLPDSRSSLASGRGRRWGRADRWNDALSQPGSSARRASSALARTDQAAAGRARPAAGSRRACPGLGRTRQYPTPPVGHRRATGDGPRRTARPIRGWAAMHRTGPGAAPPQWPRGTLSGHRALQALLTWHRG